MGKLVFIGLGLFTGDLPYRAVEVIRRADAVFIELYTTVLPQDYIEYLIKITGRSDFKILTRSDLEDRGGEDVLEVAAKGLAVLLVGGDPFVATTHMALRVEAERRGIETEVIHSSSIISAIAGATGLHVYKFGRCVTLVYPQPEVGYIPYSTYEVILENIERGLHTLVLLDYRHEEGRAMTIPEAVSILLWLEERLGVEKSIRDRVAVGAARVGWSTEFVRADTLANLREVDFGAPPHVLVITGDLHPTEVEALEVLCRLPRELAIKLLRRR